MVNTADTAAQVSITSCGAGGPLVERLVDVPSRSRFTLSTVLMLPELAGRLVATLVEARNGAHIGVASAMYWDSGGRHWAASVVHPATPLDALP